MQVRAWVGCIGCHNRGYLNGDWITSEEAQEEQDKLLTEELTVGDKYLGGIATLQKYTEADALPHPTCNRCGSDEFDIFDSEGLGRLRGGYGEFYGAAEQINDLLDQDEWELILEVIGNFHYSLSDLDEARQYHHDHFVGTYASEAEFTSQYMDDSVPAELRNIQVLGRPILDWIDPEEGWRYTLQYEYWTAKSGTGDIHLWAN